MRKSPLSRPRALQILELKCKCILERDDRRKSCLMGFTYWCKIMSRAAFDLTCMFCNMLQGKLLTSSKANKLLTCRAWNRIMSMLMKMSPPGSPWCPGQPLPYHTCLQFATDLLKLEQVLTPQKQCRNSEAGSADTPREQEQEHWMLRMVTILLDSIVDIKQHKAETS